MSLPFDDPQRPIIASVSGGKDSIAMALWLLEQELPNPLHFVFADTGWEHPELYRYLNEVVEPLLAPNFHRVKSKKYPGGMKDLVISKGAFPARMSRFCTDNLKKTPIRDFIRTFPKEPLPINAVGIRAAESKARSKMLEWEPGSILGANLCDTWRPLITATLQDVVDIHTRNNIAPCSLYLRKTNAVQRVGCYPCIMESKASIRALSHDTERIAEIRELEAVVTEKAAARLAEKGETFESMGWSNPSFFQAKNRTGACWPIDKVVKWSQTSHGGSQLELGADKADTNELFLPKEPGCAMWGLCAEHPNDKGEFSA
jgi:3'-phosphoadenosine 5'-phosphosulfate sulfotransferase (PAPS reductase)/FAD synthetase